MLRMIAVTAASKPLVEISQDGETLSIKTSTTVRTTHITFTVGQEFNEATVDGRPCTVLNTQTQTYSWMLFHIVILWTFTCTNTLAEEMGVWGGSCPDYINLFNLAFHHIWTDSISSPLPWSLKAYHATLCSFTLFTTPFNFPSLLHSPFLPFPALHPSLILPVAFPRFPIDGLCVAVSKANTCNQPALRCSNDERITSYHLSVITPLNLPPLLPPLATLVVSLPLSVAWCTSAHKLIYKSTN